ncbi:MAG: hypothetical protein V4511_09490 [Bacteroidota bacterium]
MKRLCFTLLFMLFVHETIFAQNPIELKANTYGIMDASGKILKTGYNKIKRIQGGDFVVKGEIKRLRDGSPVVGHGVNGWYYLNGELYSKRQEKKDEKRKEKQEKIKKYVAPIALVPAKVIAVAGVKNVSSYGCGVYSIQEFNYSRLVDSMGNDLGVTVGRKDNQTTAYIDSLDYPFINGTAIFHTTIYGSKVYTEEERAYWAEFHRKEQAELLKQKLKKQEEAKAIDEYVNGVKCEECGGTGKVYNLVEHVNSFGSTTKTTVNTHNSERGCPVCSGKGKVKKK